jgi:hypothetical protein
MKKLSKVLLSLAMLAAVVMLAIPNGTVAAQTDLPQLEKDDIEQPKGLDGLYAEMLDRFTQAGERMDDADEAVDRLEGWIETLTEAGEDPAEPQAILDTFLANMGTVQAAYDDLGELFDEHAGFDSEGQVTDESLAVYTLRQIADGLLDLHQAGEDARFELRWDLMEYRYARRGEE